MPLQKADRLEVHIEATKKAAQGVEKLIRGAGPALKSETRSCRKTPDGGVLFVIECDNELELDKLFFRIEKTPGAAVHRCTSV